MFLNKEEVRQIAEEVVGKKVANELNQTQSTLANILESSFNKLRDEWNLKVKSLTATETRLNDQLGNLQGRVDTLITTFSEVQKEVSSWRNDDQKEIAKWRLESQASAKKQQEMNAKFNEGSEEHRTAVKDHMEWSQANSEKQLEATEKVSECLIGLTEVLRVVSTDLSDFLDQPAKPTKKKATRG